MTRLTDDTDHEAGDTSDARNYDNYYSKGLRAR
ncbi:unnamed protein product [Protopolystoma xenopodis]|uniref:Uncharacterized protein n=1 Tax=Protopolystoma xenopodis TaxID=117903 RepID=A0A448X5Y0_9PLAT|nr:unnamed protein product [Protopolystoma xenopodis]